MEQNGHKDGFEDFLKGSFDRYDDSPSGDLWDRIEADLQTDRRNRLFVYRRWVAGIAASLVFLLLVGQYVRYQLEFEDLVDQVEENANTLEQIKSDIEQAEIANVPSEQVSETKEAVSPTQSSPQEAQLDAIVSSEVSQNENNYNAQQPTTKTSNQTPQIDEATINSNQYSNFK